MLNGPLLAILFATFHVDRLPRMHSLIRFDRSRRGRLATTESMLSVELSGKATTCPLSAVLQAPCIAFSSKIGVKTTNLVIAILSAALRLGTYDGALPKSQYASVCIGAGFFN